MAIEVLFVASEVKLAIDAEGGVIEYPKLRLTEKVLLEDRDIKYLEATVVDMKKLIDSDNCPPAM